MLAPLRGIFRMRTPMTGLLLAAMLLAAPAAAAPNPHANATAPPAPPRFEGFEARVVDRLVRLRKEGFDGCESGKADLLVIVRSKAFSGLSQTVKRNALFSILTCTRRNADPDALFAARLLEPIAVTPVERGMLNYHLMTGDLGRGKDRLQAARRLLAVMDSYPGMVDHWEAPWFGSMLIAAKKDPALELALLSRLVKADWTHPSAKDAARVWWRMDLARRQADLKDVAAMRATLAPVDDPDSLISIALDRRFEPLWPEMEAAGRFDWKAVADANVANKRALLAREPDRLSNIMALMDALRLTGGAEEARTLGEAARARLATPGAFVDQEDNSPWLLLSLTSALGDLGREAESDALFRQLIPVSDKTSDRISQRVNWSGDLINAGRAAEALTLLQEIGDKDGSPYGIGWRDSGMVCALSDIDRKRATALLARMAPKWEDNPAAVYQAQLCLGRVDEAAALLVRRLESPRHRDGAISANLTGSRGALPRTPFIARVVETRDKVLARPEVIKALARYSRPIKVPYGGDYATPY